MHKLRYRQVLQRRALGERAASHSGVYQLTAASLPSANRAPGKDHSISPGNNMKADIFLLLIKETRDFFFFYNENTSIWYLKCTLTLLMKQEYQRVGETAHLTCPRVTRDSLSVSMEQRTEARPEPEVFTG